MSGLIKVVVGVRLGWTMGHTGGKYWWIKDDSGKCKHIGEEKYIRRVWKQYRIGKNFAGEAIMSRWV